MSKKSKIIIFFLATTIVIGSVIVAVAQNVLWDQQDPESRRLKQMLRNGEISQKMWEDLWEEYERKEAYQKLSDQEKMRIKEKAYQQYLLERTERMSRPAQPFPAPETGILSNGIDSPMPGSVFIQTEPADSVPQLP